jgi:propionyl-CoA carboxylase alpha chain
MIRRLLVANRGEIARRVFASCRSLGIETVAVYSDADADSPHVREADVAVRLPGEAPSATYLRIEALVAAAREVHADAVHPGYGFLSENPAFAQAVIDAGLVWVGPPPKAIAAMGSKLEAKALLADAGVQTLPSWTDPAEVTAFPVLVKASAGGGGRGMRIVDSKNELEAAIAAARREAASAFGDGTVFCERYVAGARHVEVQIFADSHGNVVTFGERECSIQRRHQKIIEEAPSPAVTPALRAEMGDAAIAAAQAVGYIGAGTVEFLLAPDGEFFFLEMNTRLQVEHPVTECVVGFDLVRLQLLVAEGATLPTATPPPLRGHAIEVRLYAEDPAYAWRPATGTLHAFDVPGVAGTFAPLFAPGLRLDSGVEAGSVVGVHYDPMLAKLVAWAPTRPEAARLLAATLARTRIHGLVTNRDLLVRVLRHPTFLSGEFDTGFLDRQPEVFVPLLGSVDGVRLSCLAAALAGAAARRAALAETVWGEVPSGWRNVPSAGQVTVFDGPAGQVEVRYRLDRAGHLTTEPGVSVVSLSPTEVVLDSGGVRHAFSVHTVGDVSYVDSAEGSVTLTELPRYPLPAPEEVAGSLVAPMPGAVGQIAVVPGQRVAAGELVLTLEAMKLEHPLHAPADGVVAELRVEPGAQVEAGAVLAIVTPPEPPD